MYKKKRNTFFQRVYEIVVKIPKGNVVSYGQIASFLGNPRNARMVGWAMHSSPASIPWHRVVMKTGRLPLEFQDFNGNDQRKILQDEGVSFRMDGTVQMEKSTWEIEI